MTQALQQKLLFTTQHMANVKILTSICDVDPAYYVMRIRDLPLQNPEDAVKMIWQRSFRLFVQFIDSTRFDDLELLDVVAEPDQKTGAYAGTLALVIRCPDKTFKKNVKKHIRLDKFKDIFNIELLGAYHTYCKQCKIVNGHTDEVCKKIDDVADEDLGCFIASL